MPNSNFFLIFAYWKWNKKLFDNFIYPLNVGDTFGIPDVVMGMLFLAIGGSVPEGTSAFINSRNGEILVNHFKQIIWKWF